jgi:hypothetical protein
MIESTKYTFCGVDEMKNCFVYLTTFVDNASEKFQFNYNKTILSNNTRSTTNQTNKKTNEYETINK